MEKRKKMGIGFGEHTAMEAIESRINEALALVMRRDIESVMKAINIINEVFASNDVADLRIPLEKSKHYDANDPTTQDVLDYERRREYRYYGKIYLDAYKVLGLAYYLYACLRQEGRDPIDVARAGAVGLDKIAGTIEKGVELINPDTWGGDDVMLGHHIIKVRSNDEYRLYKAYMAKYAASACIIRKNATFLRIIIENLPADGQPLIELNEKALKLLTSITKNDIGKEEYQGLKVDIYGCLDELARLYEEVGELEKAAEAKRQARRLLEENREVAEMLGK